MQHAISYDFLPYKSYVLTIMIGVALIDRGDHYQKSADMYGYFKYLEINGRIMSNDHPYVLFAGVGQLPTCKQCYYTTTELLKPKHFKSFTVAKLDFTIHRLSNGRPNCELKKHRNTTVYATRSD